MLIINGFFYLAYVFEVGTIFSDLMAIILRIGPFQFLLCAIAYVKSFLAT